MAIVVFPDRVLEIGQRQLTLLSGMGLVEPIPSSDEFRGRNAEHCLTVLAEHPAEMVCDICKGQPVVMEYPAEDFVMWKTHKETENSIQGWMFCQACSEIMEDARLQREQIVDKLVGRAMKQFTEMTVPELLATDIALHGIYRELLDHRVGPGRRI